MPLVILAREVPVVFASGVSAVSPRQFHSAAATNDGRVWAWGSNTSRQLGDAPPSVARRPQVGARHAARS
jgi:alpha-tubulin suppressor-like RCC1 family protein